MNFSGNIEPIIRCFVGAHKTGNAVAPARTAQCVSQPRGYRKDLAHGPANYSPGQMSGQYKVAWLCEALLVSRSGYYGWKERRRQPGPRQLENSRLRERYGKKSIY